MAKATKSKRSSPAKGRAKRKASKPLLAATADVRKAKPRAKARRSPVASPTATGMPVFGGFEFFGRVIGAYAELPFSLARCRTPIDLWQAQARFAERIFGQSLPASGK